MTSVYRPHWKTGPALDPERCAASVSGVSQGIRSYQCQRRVKLTEDGYGWCRQHAPSAVRARREEERRKRDERWAARERREADQKELREIRDDAMTLLCELVHRDDSDLRDRVEKWHSRLEEYEAGSA